ncbi:MAG: hypothetical protein ACE5GE_07650 [Phycisphaerae bacterium]
MTSIRSACMFLAFFAPVNVPGQAQVEETPSTQNPHWSAQGCGRCHKLADGVPQAIELAMIDGLCLDCHDGARASRELHPIGRAVDAPGIAKPADWPAPDGRLGCITCHDVRQACQQRPARPTLNAVFLRSPGAVDTGAFCGQCHQAVAEQGRHNPHRMIDVKGRVDAQACLFCHESAPAGGEGIRRTGQPRLRIDEPALCVTCHGSHVDYFEPGHIQAQPTPQIKAALEALAARAGDTRPSIPSVPGRSVCANLPLAPDGRVVCSTCHNPHQQGVFPDKSVLGCGGRPMDLSRPRPHRGLGKSLCAACHGK